MPENNIPILLAKNMYPFERLFERIFLSGQLEQRNRIRQV